jgi:hypothetical protein
MSTLPKTRAAAGYALRHARTEAARTRAAVLLRRLTVCEAALATENGQLPFIVAGLLRSLILATRDLVGPAWLRAKRDDPDIAAFTALRTTASPSNPATIDDICSRVLWARFAAAGAPRDGSPDDFPESTC